MPIINSITDYISNSSESVQYNIQFIQYMLSHKRKLFVCYTSPSCGKLGMGSNWAVPTWNGFIMDSYLIALLFLSSCSQYSISILSHLIFSSYGRPWVRNESQQDYFTVLSVCEFIHLNMYQNPKKLATKNFSLKSLYYQILQKTTLTDICMNSFIQKVVKFNTMVKIMTTCIC